MELSWASPSFVRVPLRELTRRNLAHSLCRHVSARGRFVTICNGAAVRHCLFLPLGRHDRQVHSFRRGRPRHPYAAGRLSRARGLRRRGRRGRCRRRPRACPDETGPGDPRHHAARRGRPFDLPSSAHAQRGAGYHADRQERRHRSHRRARARPRRLSRQAIQPARAARPDSRHPASSRATGVRDARAPSAFVCRLRCRSRCAQRRHQGRNALAADGGRIRSARLLRRAAASGPDPRPAVGLDARPQRRSVRPHHRRDRQPAAQEARGCRSGRGRRRHHRAQRRLSVFRRSRGALTMRRLGLVWRVALIVIAAFVAIQMIAAAAYYIHRDRATESGFRLPLPDQIAAIVQLVERTPPDQRTLVLRIANGAGLRVAIERQAPPEPDRLQRAPWIEATVARYLGESGDHAARAYYLGSEYHYALGTFSWKPLRVVYPLTSGGVLVAETVDELTVRVLGLPPGFWAGILGFVVAALALYAVVRETSPLARLARSVERFEI